MNEPVAPTQEATSPEGTATPPAPAVREPAQVRLFVAVLVLVGAVLLAVVAVGAVVALRDQRLPGGPALDPPAPTAAGASVRYDQATGVAALEELKLTVPGRPYVCDPAIGQRPDVLASVVSCDAVVHADYDAAGDDWYANAGLALLDPSLVSSGDAKAVGDRVFSTLRGLFFADQKTTLTSFASSPVDLGQSGPARVVSGEVHYAVKGLPSTYDRMLLIVVPLESGRWGVVFSVRPSDTPKTTLAVLDRSLNTVTARP